MIRMTQKTTLELGLTLARKLK